MRLLYRLIIPNKAFRWFPRPPLMPEYISLKLREHYVPQMADMLYAESPLFKRLKD